MRHPVASILVLLVWALACSGSSGTGIDPLPPSPLYPDPPPREEEFVVVEPGLGPPVQLSPYPFPAFGVIMVLPPTNVTSGNNVFVAFKASHELYRNPSLRTEQTLYFTRSTDGGANFEPPVSLLEADNAYENIKRFSLVRDRCGTLYLLVHFWKQNWERGNYLWRSGDRGATFERLGPLPSLPDYNEPLWGFTSLHPGPTCGQIIGLVGVKPFANDIRLWRYDVNTQEMNQYSFEIFFPWETTEMWGAAMARTDTGRIFVAFLYLDIPSRRSQLVVFRSDDDGQSFSFRKRVVDDELYTPNLFGDVQAIVTPDGETVFIVWQNLQDRDMTKRQAVLSVSRDGGVTWEEPRQFNDLTTMCLVQQNGDYENGRLYLWWGQQCRDPLYPFGSLWIPADVKARYSDDLGRTFSPAVKVNPSRKFVREGLAGVGNTQSLSVVSADASGGGLDIVWSEGPYSLVGELPMGRARFVGGDYLFFARWSP